MDIHGAEGMAIGALWVGNHRNETRLTQKRRDFMTKIARGLWGIVSREVFYFNMKAYMSTMR